MEIKKVNWKDKDTIKTVTEESSSYNEVLKKLGLKPVSSNVRTLKKYLEKYNINTSHFSFTKDDGSKYNVVKGNEPMFKMEGVLKDPSQGLRVELDWNKAFVDYLKQVGFRGDTDEVIVGQWLNDMYKPLGDRMIN